MSGATLQHVSLFSAGTMLLRSKSAMHSRHCSPAGYHSVARAAPYHLAQKCKPHPWQTAVTWPGSAALVVAAQRRRPSDAPEAQLLVNWTWRPSIVMMPSQPLVLAETRPLCIVRVRRFDLLVVH